MYCVSWVKISIEKKRGGGGGYPMLTVRVGRIKPKIVPSRGDICEVRNSESQGVGVVPHIIRMD